MDASTMYKISCTIYGRDGNVIMQNEKTCRTEEEAKTAFYSAVNADKKMFEVWATKTGDKFVVLDYVRGKRIYRMEW